jgi:hypothetical protein
VPREEEEEEEEERICVWIRSVIPKLLEFEGPLTSKNAVGPRITPLVFVY